MVVDYEKHGASSIAVENVPKEKTNSYGIVDVNDAQQLQQIVEKPDPEDAPSTLAVVGRYLLTPAIFRMLAKTGRGAGGEIQLTDAIADLLAEEPVYAFRFAGKRHDCGSKLGYIEATLEVAKSDPEIIEALGGRALT
jgi:UTP--glucose-1-phosphate uridylyltransferase